MNQNFTIRKVNTGWLLDSYVDGTSHYKKLSSVLHAIARQEAQQEKWRRASVDKVKREAKVSK